MNTIEILKERLGQYLNPHQVLYDPDSLAFYGKDWLKDFTPHAALVLLPESPTQVQEIVKACRELGVAIVPSGGRTGLSGGATAIQGEVILSLERMRRIIDINRIDRTVKVEAGVALERLQQEAAAHNLYFPIDFSSRGSAHIGGNIATNAGGIRVIRYGNIRDWVVGLTVVTGAGEILELNGSLFKNNTGFDLRHLFIGSEGTLGIIVDATVRLTSPPRDTARVLCGIKSNEDILPLLSFCRDSLRELSAFEFMERNAYQEVICRRGLKDPLAASHAAYVIIEVELNSSNAHEQLIEICGAAYEKNLVEDIVVSETNAQAQELMSIRDLIGETLAQHYTLHKNDISVPVPSIPAFLRDLHESITRAYPTFSVVVFGHVGDGNLHVNVLKPQGISDADFWTSCHEADHVVFSLVQRYRGSISAEHGVGLLKRDFLHYTRSQAELTIMRSIKQAFDPDGIMNPGKILHS
jgi:FAD/FMN-containing dehydrogenase